MVSHEEGLLNRAVAHAVTPGRPQDAVASSTEGYTRTEAAPSWLDHEEARLRALQDLDLLDTPVSDSFDRITRMVSRLFQAPIAAISLTDRCRQWFKSHIGTPGREIPREGAPCAEVTRSTRTLVIPDLLEDSRFATCGLAAAGVRFYVGEPLTTRDGYVLGALCALDRKPRIVSSDSLDALRDLAAMVMAQVELQHDFGRIDPLSGLPNRNQLTEDLADLQRQGARDRRVMVLLDLVDPRHVSSMVSFLGTAWFDAIVKTASRTIRQALGRKTGLYHVSASSFAVVLDEEQDHAWRDVVARLAADLKTPVICNGVPVTISPAFGISPFLLGGEAPQDALRTAVSAAHDAREAEIEYAVYSPASDEANRRRFTLLTDIREALQQPGQLSLVYQPRVDLRTRACVSAEALLRWCNPRLGNVSPGEFIPLVEQTALARPVTQWVIATALEQVAAWRRAGLDMRVSINISAHNLEEPDFAQGVAAALQRHAVPAAAIELEFTESALIRNRSRVLGQLEQLRAMGVELAIDDFGTGYSTFSYLQNLPASTVKLDQSFMRTLAGSPRNQMLVRSIIAMAHDLGYRVVAEGVETAEDYDFLVASACDEVQGYFISRPRPAVAFDGWIRERQTISMLGLLGSRSGAGP